MFNDADPTLKISPETALVSASRHATTARAASCTCKNGRHCSPFKTVIFPEEAARATNKFTTKSNRIRGESPNKVPNRKIVGANPTPDAIESSPRDAAASKIFSESTFVCAYTESGFTADVSSRRNSDSPYTPHDDANTNRRTPHPLATS